MEENPSTDLRNHCLVLYVLYALSAFLQFSQLTLLIGVVTLLVAYIVTVAHKKVAVDTPYASHLRWMARTFWIGGAVVVPVAVLIATGLILYTTDILSLSANANSEDPTALMNSIHEYMRINENKIALITLATILPAAAWWLRRCWYGYGRAKAGLPIENVKSWL